MVGLLSRTGVVTLALVSFMATANARADVIPSPSTIAKAHHSLRDAFQEKVAVSDNEVYSQIESFITLSEKNLAFRYRASAFLSDIIKEYYSAQESGEDYLLGPADLEKMMLGARKLLDLRAELWSTAELYRVFVKFNRDDKILIDRKPESWYERIKGYYEVDTRTREGQSFVKKVALSLAAGLTLYDNYFSLVSNYENLEILRRKLNHGNKSYSIPQGELDIISEGIRSFSNRSDLRDALALFDDYLNSLKMSQRHINDEQLEYLASVIKQSPSAKLFRKSIAERSWTMLGLRIKNGLFFNLRDGRKDLGRDAMDTLSGLFGNAVGLIEFRKGKLYQKPSVNRVVRSQLKPLDVILEKTPFRVTDRFIPGHWGHVAIWVGNMQELKSEGLWDLVVKTDEWQAMKDDKKQFVINALNNNRSIVEALRSGVEINTLEHFLNIDDFVAIRPTYILSKQEKAVVIARALSHVGKEYDFNFDVSSVDKIVCSELAYQTYINVEWPIEKTLGRYSISPDQVAVMGGDHVPFRVVELWHDGKRVEGTQTELDYAYQELLIDSTLHGRGSL